MQILPSAHCQTRIALPTWLKQCGVTIKKGAYGSDNFYPNFAKVLTVFFVLDIVILDQYKVDFDDHFNAYVVVPSTHRSFVRFDHLKDHSILYTCT